MSNKKDSENNNKKKTINCWPLIVFGMIISIFLTFIILTRSNFTLKINGTELSYIFIEETPCFPIICILTTIGFLFCIGVFYIISYKILKQEEKLKLLDKFFNKEGLNYISEDKTTTTKNKNLSKSAVDIETIEAHTYDSKSKVLISAIEAIKDL